MARKYTEARAASNKKYDDKTYKKITFMLRIEEDAEILEDISRAKSEGIPLRQWLHDLWENRDPYLK